ncbi:MAG TPA: ATP synthase F1 subunit delta [Candidatus Hydrogenedens sp.]|nr:ATP synthase F1 subunit delta [Candidatus Hydrogenedens sp.]HOK08679.1 ATP synthase F1 subunit delta [Candidatus Hydrogenedens sp.]HOL21010.1 ATP synthase F1 subunit delta [Candidatus Hydrogenedens sp.]HPP58280.1 ATP synthase F1 subunit delta [Candidatus Hydrogenedens sp.]
MNYTTRNKLATRYAEALKSLIHDEQELLKVNEAYQTLSAVMRKEPRFMSFLKNPSIPYENKILLLNKILETVNPPDYFIKLGEYLIKRQRVDLIPYIADVFLDKIDPWLNRIEVEVITATRITPESEKSLIKTLEHFTGKTVRLVKQINPRILGGIIVRFYGFSFDFSYKTQLEKLKEEIMKKEIDVHVI